MNSNFAVVFPGQGSQSVEMLSEFSDNKIVQDVFTKASNVLGYDIWELTQSNPDDKLNQTEFTQPALLTASIAVWELVKNKHTQFKPHVMAGHSLGEYSALVAANSLSLEDAVQLVALRGRLMQAAVKKDTGAMAAILGLDNSIIQDVLSSYNGVEIANLNAIGQTVIAGLKDKVLLVMDELKAKGAKLVKLLDVSVPSHCSLMESAQKEFKKYLDNIIFVQPDIKVLHNYSVANAKDTYDIKDLLLKQLVAPVRWVETIQKFASMGIKDIYEFGPGGVLSKLTKRIDKNLNSVAIDSLIAVNSLIEK